MKDKEIIQCDKCKAQWVEREVLHKPCPSCGCWSGVTLDSLAYDKPKKLKL